MATIYVASSWRNERQPRIVEALRERGHDPYDFRHPADGEDGFHWREVMPSWDDQGDGLVPAGEYLDALRHPRAIRGFALDHEALDRCLACILVLPAGRSAHLELGYFTGRPKPTAILLDDPVIPELMYGLADYVTPNLELMLRWADALDELFPGGE